jgi:hypothetical protein
MRCMACGAEMRLIAVVPDRELETPGYERHTLECSACGEQETRLAFSREPTKVPPAQVSSTQVSSTQISPRTSEPPQPVRPPETAPSAADAAPSAPASAATEPSPGIAQEPAIAQEEPSSLTATARSAWETAVARLRSRQDALSEEAEKARKAEQLARFDREWEGLAPPRKPSIAAQLAGREPIPAKPAKRSAPASQPSSSSLWARAVAKLRATDNGSER